MTKLKIIPDMKCILIGGTGTSTEAVSAVVSGCNTSSNDNQYESVPANVLHSPTDLNIPNGLNHSEITFLRSLLSYTLDVIEDARQELNAEAAEYWSECDPNEDSFESRTNFDYLNATKNKLRKLKKKKIIVQNILVKLKKQSKIA